MDRAAMDELGIVSLVLMENAGRGATNAIRDVFGDCLERVVLVGGPGQNGGDGFALARHLENRGITPLVFIVGDRSRYKGDAVTNLEICDRIVVIAHGQELVNMQTKDTTVDYISKIIVRGTLGEEV